MLETYIPWWFKHYGTREIVQPLFIEQNHRVIAEQEAAHPGFSAELRRFALTLLDHADQRTVRRAIAALGPVGLPGDVDALRHAGAASGGVLAGEAAAASFEIKRRAPAT
jgi:hypothetical protein